MKKVIVAIVALSLAGLLYASPWDRYTVTFSTHIQAADEPADVSFSTHTITCDYQIFIIQVHDFIIF